MIEFKPRDIRSESRRTRGMYFVLAIIAACILFALGSTSVIGADIAQLHSRQLSAAISIRTETALAHLWLEEILEGDSNEGIDQVWGSFDLAEGHIQILLETTEPHYQFFHYVDKTELHNLTLELKAEMQDVREVARQRYAAGSIAGIGTEIDELFDGAFRSILASSELIEKKVRAVTKAEFGTFRLAGFAVGIGCVLLVLICGTWLRRCEIQRIADLKTINTGKEELGQLNEELNATNEDLIATNEELEAQYEELAATTGDLLESQGVQRESDKRMELALAGANLGTWDWNVKSGEVIFNNRWAEMMGYTIDDIPPNVESWENLVHPDDLPAVKAVLASHLEGKTESYETEHRVLHKSGQWVWVLDKGKVIERDEDGYAVRACGTQLDITERKRAEILALQYNRILEGSLNEIYIFDADTLRFVEVNRGARQNLGYSMDEMSIMTPLDLKPEHTRKSFAELVKPLRVGDEEIIQFNTVHRRKNRTQYFVEVHLQLMNVGTPVFVAIIIDITERMQAESAIIISEDRFRNLFEEAPLAYQSLDENGCLAEVNQAWINMLQCPREDALGQPITQFLTPEYQEIIKTRFPEFKRTGIICDLEFDFVRPDGTLFTASVNGQLGYHPDGSFKQTHCILTDITERKQTEEALRIAHDKLETTLSALPDLLFEIDRSGLILDYRALENELLYVPPETFLGKMMDDVLPEPAAGILNAAIAQALDTGSSMGSSYSLEMEGETSWFELSIARSGKQDDPKCLLIVLARDITKRKQDEEALKASMELIKESQKVGRLGSYVLNIVSGTWTSTAIMDEIFGIPPVENKDIKVWFELVHPDDAGKIQAYLAGHVIGQHQPFDKEYRIIRQNDGATRWVHGLGKLNFSASGDLTQMVGTIQDITERKQAEEERLGLERQVLQAQKLESLGVMAGGIAHDFNNLLMVIMGNADLALDQLSPHAPARENIAEIEIASKRAAGLAKQMLAYSGKGKFANEAIKLNEFVGEMSHLLEVNISKNVVLKFNYADNLPLLEADPNQVRQIIMNLIVNASEAVGDKSGVVSISTGAMDCTRDYLDSTHFLAQVGIDQPVPEGIYVYLEVADTGCGMDQDTLEKIFDPFFTTKFTGRGLGLAATLGIVRGHGGAIKVYSELGKGSTFKILFPACGFDDSEGVQQSRGQKQQTWQGSGTVLIADDEESIIAVGKQMLARKGFEVLVAKDGREAVDLYRKYHKKIVCVLLDLTMPYLDGNEAFREMRSICPDVKVLLCSGFNEQEATEHFTGKGLAGFIHKPFSMKELYAKLMQVLEG